MLPQLNGDFDTQIDNDVVFDTRNRIGDVDVYLFRLLFDGVFGHLGSQALDEVIRAGRGWRGVCGGCSGWLSSACGWLMLRRGRG